MNRTRIGKLGIASLTVVILAAQSLGQVPFNIASIQFRDPMRDPDNQIVAGPTETSTYFLGTTTQISGGTLTLLTSVLYENSGLRLINSASPTLYANFQLTTVNSGLPVTLTASTKTLFGPLISCQIPAGSSWQVEGYQNETAGATGVARVSGTNIAFTLNTTSAPGAVVESLAYPGPASPSPGSATTVSSLSMPMTASAAYVFGGVMRNEMSYRTVNTRTYLQEACFRIENNAFPAIVNTTFSAWPVYTGTAGSTTTITSGPGVCGTVLGGLIGSTIPTGSIWKLTPYESIDDGLDGVADCVVSNVNFGITAFAGFVGNLPTLVSYGPIYDPGNSVVTLGTVATAMRIDTTAQMSYTMTRLDTVSMPSQARLRVRNSAYPGFHLEHIPTGTYTSGTYAFASFAYLSGNLFGPIIPAGSVFTVEAYELAGQDTLNVPDQQYSNLHIVLSPSALIPPPPPTNVTALGTLTSVNPITTTVPNIPASSAKWFSFEVPAGLSRQSGRTLDVWTNATSAADTQFVIFDSAGRFIVNDNDDGPGNFSAASLGHGTGTTVVDSGTASSDGRDAEGLPPGTYYLALSGSSMQINNGFSVTPQNLSIPTALTLKLRTNVPPLTQSLSGTLMLQDTNGSFAMSRSIAYTIVQGTATLGSGAVTMNSSSAPFTLTISGSYAGAASIRWDGSSFLRRNTSINMSGSPQSLGTVSLQNGDVDLSGEVDAADIDQVISDFGQVWPGGGGSANSDADVSGEVDAADIDLVIASFGGVDD